MKDLSSDEGWPRLTWGFLRFVAPPRSDHKWASLLLEDDVEPSLLMLKDEAFVFVPVSKISH